MGGKHIPEDIIVDILSRLPVKSLCRFRCVSKRWRSIVSDPQFAKVQFKVASEQKTLSRRLLLCRNTSEIESFDLETPWYADTHFLRKLTGPFEYRERPPFVNVLGSCNGLVCVATRYPLTCFYIWNPSTGFSHNLPDPGFSNETNYISYSGFGYLPATDDYKVLVAASDIVSPGEEVVVEVKIFSTRAGFWKRIESPFKFYLTYSTSAALLEETLHWVCDSVEAVIYAFDLVTEKFREMPTLDQNDNTIHLLNVDSYGGSLYGFRHGYDAWDSIDLCVMREYGVSDSWTKLLNINFSNQLESEYMHADASLPLLGYRN
ncbi:F-box/kelch-repeat protein At3g06240-like [Rosa rugosa]|uniref:F-box/kelch-repeat protein At3g06240-like n=1 Tax=Rosa rugosa TaxID=74645 RepID=UPI002B41847B|nr:F-box/kelch-repeat protein At3g06240-like [Rosa rugosa]